MCVDEELLEKWPPSRTGGHEERRALAAEPSFILTSIIHVHRHQLLLFTPPYRLTVPLIKPSENHVCGE